MSAEAKETGTMASMRDVVCVMSKASEKAARLARCCRSDDILLRMLVNQKKDKNVNGIQFQDFKTLADVLIQEAIKFEIAEAVSAQL